MPLVKPYPKLAGRPWDGVLNALASICYVLDYLRLLIFGGVIVGVVLYAAYWIYTHPAHV